MWTCEGGAPPGRAPVIAETLAPHVAIDEVALRQYFAFDHMLGDRTWWTGIGLIPPANV